MMANVLDGTQPAPEGETVANAGNETAPEQTNDQQHTDNVEGNAGEEVEGQADGNAAGEGTGEEEQQEQPKPEKKKQPWELRRIAELTAKKNESDRRAADLEAELAKLRGNPPNEEKSGDPSIEEIRRQERDRIRNEERTAHENSRFNEACNALYKKGVDEVDGFADAVQTFNDALGSEAAQRNDFYEAIIDLPNGHQVFAELGRNLEEAERILRLSPVKMAMEIARISDRAAKPAAPAPKPISKAPAPVTPIGGAARVSDRLEDPNIPMDTFAKKLLSDLASRGH